MAAAEVAQIALYGDRKTLKEGFSLTPAEIKDAVRWWNKVREYESAA